MRPPFFVALEAARTSRYLKWRAGMAKLVDARDLKSLGLGHPGSIPGARTNTSPYAFADTGRSAWKAAMPASNANPAA